MEKKNGFKMFETTLVNKGKLNNQDLKDLGITKERALKIEAHWRKNDMSIIPSQDEKK